MLGNLNASKKDLIKDLLPYGWKSGDPLFYCDTDDTFHASKKEWSFHQHQYWIDRDARLIAKYREEANGYLREMSICKSKTYPQLQSRLDGINKRLKVLLASRDWRETNKSHAEKRREIVELEYKRYQTLDELHKAQSDFATLKRKYQQAMETIEYYKGEIDKKKRKFEEAKEWWKTQEAEGKEL